MLTIVPVANPSRLLRKHHERMIRIERIHCMVRLASATTLLISTSLPAAEPLSVSAASQANETIPVPAPIAEKGYRLVKNWDFATTVTTREKLFEEFHTRYVYDNGTMDHFNDEWERYRDNDNHVFGNQTLQLVARVSGPDGLKNGAIESGMLRSRWNGKYGYFECCLKVPRGRGMWPAFWLYPADGKGPAEIDILEVVNNGKDTTRASFHFVHTLKGKSSPITSKLNKWGRYDSPVDYADDFHVFAVEWTPGKVTHYVDGQVVVSRNFEWLLTGGGEAGPATVLLNLAVGGKWPKEPQAMSDFPAELAVKYIRVWQQEAQPETQGD